jgi:hypothetical protein
MRLIIIIGGRPVRILAESNMEELILFLKYIDKEYGI